MSAHCQHHHHDADAAPGDIPPGYRKALWIALIVNAALFFIEIGAGWSSRSVSLLADAIDFFGDSVGYGLSLAVLSMAVAWRSRVAWWKGWSMVAFGALVLGRAAWAAWAGAAPEAVTMGVIGVLALLGNVGVGVLLYAYRNGDANMRSVWLCTRNDALGNAAVLLAALGVFGTGTRWPDLAVAAVMAGLALTGGISVVRQARAELGRQPAACPGS